MIGPFTLVSCLCLFFGGAFVALGWTLLGVALATIGAGWNGILFATYQREIQNARHGGHQ